LRFCPQYFIRILRFLLSIHAIRISTS
jgi:hypothetical protein